MTEKTPMTSAIVIADQAGKIVAFDAGAEEFFGHSASDAIGCSLDLIVPSDLREPHWKGFYGAVEAGHANLELQPIHLPARGHDGSAHVFPAVFRLLRDPHGNTIGAVATFSPAVDAEIFTPVA